MINVRVEIAVSPKRILVSAPIRDPQALAALHTHFGKKYRRKITVFDDPHNAIIADQALAIARQEGSIVELVWGPGERYVVEVAGLPEAKGGLMPIVGGFPLLEDRQRGEVSRSDVLARQAAEDAQIEQHVPAWLVHLVELAGRVHGFMLGWFYWLVLAPPRLRLFANEESGK
jgi:hypothetical protein